MGLSKLSRVLDEICLLKTDNSDFDTDSESDLEKPMLQLDGPLDSASSEGSTSSSNLQVRAVRRIRGKTMEETDDKSFFRPKEALEDEIRKNPKIQIRNYLGNLRNEKGFKIVKNDTLALVDGDVMGNLKENTKESIVFVKLLKCKTENDEKKHLAICLKCNSKDKTNAFISSVDKSTKVSKKVELDNINNCSHSEVSEVLFDAKKSKEANMSSSMCEVITDNEKLYLATSFDGQSHGLIHINKARKGNKAHCHDCKSTKCSHTKVWDKEFKNIFFQSKCEEEEGKEEGENYFKFKSNHKLEYPFSKETQSKMRKADSTMYENKTNFLPKKDGACPHISPWDQRDPIENGWIYSSDVKIAHSTYIEDRTRRVYYRSVLGQKY